MVNAMYDIAQIWLNMGKCGIQTILTQYLPLCKCVNLSSVCQSGWDSGVFYFVGLDLMEFVPCKI